MTDDSLGPLLERLRRTVVRFGDERDDRLAIDSGEGSMGDLTWGDMRRLDHLMRAASRLDGGEMMRRLTAEDAEHRRWRESMRLTDSLDQASPEDDLGEEEGGIADP